MYIIVQEGVFGHILKTIQKSMDNKSTLMSLFLVGCASSVVIGVGAAMVAVAKRNQFLIQVK